MKNNKGLSTVVTTLIIILLVLVAVGIIWGVVNNLLGKSTGTIQISQRCMDVDMTAKKVVSTAVSGEYNITLERSSTGDEKVYAKVTLFNENGDASSVESFGNYLNPLGQKTRTVTFADDISAPTKIRVTPYFIDDSGKDQLCQTSTYFEFEL